MPTIVIAKPGDSVDQIIKKFKKKVLQEDILTLVREREYYKKPSVVKKEKLRELKKRRK